mmetsp:Transcript_4781/g.19163  ORF Transcript_4781/g.19163 Transcript_4781/m.19163 type:complete len:124 (-) Transcript_4781:102-473(-)
MVASKAASEEERVPDRGSEALINANKFVKDNLLPRPLRDTALAYLAFEVLPGLAVAARSQQRSRPQAGLPNANLALREVAPPLQRVGSKYTEKLRQRARDRLQKDIESQRAMNAISRSKRTEI